MAVFDELWQPVVKLQAAVANGPDAISDADVIRAITDFNDSLAWHVNAETAASLLFSAVAPIAVRRPHLTEQLMQEPVWALMNHLYRDGSSIADWIKYQLAQPRPFDGVDMASQQWLRKQAEEPEKIQGYVRRIISEFDKNSE
ncbi:MAG: hypothetical protein U0793_00485 [Gemmataceae bacterium]